MWVVILPLIKCTELFWPQSTAGPLPSAVTPKENPHTMYKSITQLKVNLCVSQAAIKKRSVAFSVLPVWFVSCLLNMAILKMCFERNLESPQPLHPSSHTPPHILNKNNKTACDSTLTILLSTSVQIQFILTCIVSFKHQVTVAYNSDKCFYCLLL